MDSDSVIPADSNPATAAHEDPAVMDRLADMLAYRENGLTLSDYFVDSTTVIKESNGNL